MEPTLILKKGKEAFVQRYHPWIFSGAIAREEGDPQEGDLIAVQNNKGQIIAHGHYQEGSIRVRVLSLGEAPPPSTFWQDSIAAAWQARQILGLPNTNTDTYRLVHAAGDKMPGLVVDIYGHVAVVQCHSWGMYQARMDISHALQATIPNLQGIYCKSAATLPKRFQGLIDDEWLKGAANTLSVTEHGHHFRIDPATGQKTGFFLDQRENRLLLAKYAEGKSVLNTFCYSGGFSIYALKAGASTVTSIDLSATAMVLLEQNIDLNGLNASKHNSVTGDVLPFLQEHQEAYDIVVVDPPAYAKSFSKRHKAVQGYKRLNIAAIERVKPGGLLFTFSCSKVVDRQLFYDTIVAAGLTLGRHARVLHHLAQGPDHPVSLFHPEGAYLKGLVVCFD